MPHFRNSSICCPAFGSVRAAGGFSRIDLLATCAVLSLALGWLCLRHTGERGRSATCARNLAILGQAVALNANDHGGGLPPAGVSIGKMQLSWDMELAGYMKSGQKTAVSVYARKQLLQSSSQTFLCPSDDVSHEEMGRSYAMPGCSMKPEDLMTDNWPPSKSSKTGLGVWWDDNTVATLLKAETAQAVIQNPESYPRLNSSIVSAPADTLLMTELIATNNLLGSTSRSRVWNVYDQKTTFQGDSSRHHFGRFNYLMVDGHVESLSGLQTKGVGRPLAGIWTIDPGD